jgi:hypothetical protein
MKYCNNCNVTFESIDPYTYSYKYNKCPVCNNNLRHCKNKKEVAYNGLEF